MCIRNENSQNGITGAPDFDVEFPSKNGIPGAPDFDVEFPLVEDRRLGELGSGGGLGNHANRMCADFRPVRNHPMCRLPGRETSRQKPYNGSTVQTMTPARDPNWVITLPLRARRGSPNTKPVIPKRKTRDIKKSSLLVAQRPGWPACS